MLDNKPKYIYNTLILKVFGLKFCEINFSKKVGIWKCNLLLFYIWKSMYMNWTKFLESILIIAKYYNYSKK